MLHYLQGENCALQVTVVLPHCKTIALISRAHNRPKAPRPSTIDSSSGSSGAPNSYLKHSNIRHRDQSTFPTRIDLSIQEHPDGHAVGPALAMSAGILTDVWISHPILTDSLPPVHLHAVWPAHPGGPPASPVTHLRLALQWFVYCECCVEQSRVQWDGRASGRSRTYP